jgi:type VI secretion system protein ImpI
MTLTLHIENETSLPDGGPLSVSIKGKRGLDIGRDPYLDWTLPDPSRFISGRHCEVRWHGGAYWLHDISTNGTFLNGAESRLKAPHRLRNGDRFVIGQYIIAATLDDEVVDREPPAPLAAPPRHDDLWGGVSDAAMPVDPRQLKAPRDAAPVRPDFLDWAVDVPAPVARPASPGSGYGSPVRAGGADVGTGEDSWAKGSPPPPVPQPVAMPVPNPRRPEPGNPIRPWTPASADPSDAGAPVRSEPDGQQPEPEAWSVLPHPAPAVTAQGTGDSNAMASFAQLIARGAGLPDDAFAGRDPAELAEQFGKLLRLATDNMKQLLEARQQAKRLARSPNQTTVQAINNNPLKFAPTPEDALRIMFVSQSRAYLDAERAFAQGFDDLKVHQIRTYSAMQQAVALLMKDLDPASIEAGFKSDRGLAGMVGSRKAQLWDVYVARWQAHAQRHDNGTLDTFMDYFARCYDDE